MEQLSMFDFSVQTLPKTEEVLQLRSVGEKIGRVVLGECRIATITSIEGNEKHWFYRTDCHGCYSYEEGLQDIDDLMEEAALAHLDYNTFFPKNLTERLTVEYTRQCDNRILWAQIGILDNMLFWKENCTFQFLEPYTDPKKLRKEYEKHKKELMKYSNRENFRICDTEHPMECLYWSKNGYYATAEYVKFHG